MTDELVRLVPELVPWSLRSYDDDIVKLSADSEYRELSVKLVCEFSRTSIRSGSSNSNLPEDAFTSSDPAEELFIDLIFFGVYSYQCLPKSSLSFDYVLLEQDEIPRLSGFGFYTYESSSLQAQSTPDGCRRNVLIVGEWFIDIVSSKWSWKATGPLPGGICALL